MEVKMDKWARRLWVAANLLHHNMACRHVVAEPRRQDKLWRQAVESLSQHSGMPESACAKALSAQGNRSEWGDFHIIEAYQMGDIVSPIWAQACGGPKYTPRMERASWYEAEGAK